MGAMRVSSRTASGLTRDQDWRRWLGRRLFLTDLLVLIWVAFGVQIAWFRLDSAEVAFQGALDQLAVSYSTVSIVLIIGWMCILAIYDTRDARVIGSGHTEYRLIVEASMRWFGIVAIIAYLFQINLARGYILIAFPLGVSVLWLSRWLWRQWLYVKRQTGEYSSRVILVGSPNSIRHLRRELASHPEEGYHVVGECWTGEDYPSHEAHGLPIYFDLESIDRAMFETKADTLIITGTEELTPERVRRLSWKLDGERQQLILGASLVDVAGPRILTHPVARLPLIHVDVPRYDGPRHLGKRALDMIGSLVLIVSVAPAAYRRGGRQGFECWARYLPARTDRTQW